MSVDKGSKKRLDMKALAAMVGLDRARDDDACAHGEAIFARLPPDAYDDPAIDLHDKLSELLDAARSITPATGGANQAAREAELPKFLNSTLDDYIIGTIAAGTDAARFKADATDTHREPGGTPATSMSGSRPLRQRIGEAMTAVSTIAVFCAFGASVGTLSALGFAPRQNDAAYATMAKGLSVRSVSRDEIILRRFEFVTPDRCADMPCPTLTLKVVPPAGVAPAVRATKAGGDAANAGQPETLTSVRDPDAAPVVSPAGKAVAVAEPPPPVITVEDAHQDVEVVELEPVLPAPDGFDALSAVVLRGLPAGSTLSAGRKISDTEWTLPAGDLDNVVVTFPENVPSRFRATVELIQRNGQPAASLNIVVRHTPGSRSVPLAAIAKDAFEQRDADPDRDNPDNPAATAHEDNAKDPAQSGSRVADEASEKTKPARKVARARAEAAKPAPKAKKPRTAAAKSAPQPPQKAPPPQAAMTIRQPRDLDAGAQIQHSLGAPVWGPPAPTESATPTTLFGLLFGEPEGEQP